jgi:hypothetical protein
MNCFYCERVLTLEEEADAGHVVRSMRPELSKVVMVAALTTRGAFDGPEWQPVGQACPQCCADPADTVDASAETPPMTFLQATQHLVTKKDE